MRKSRGQITVILPRSKGGHSNFNRVPSKANEAGSGGAPSRRPHRGGSKKMGKEGLIGREQKKKAWGEGGATGEDFLKGDTTSDLGGTLKHKREAKKVVK